MKKTFTILAILVATALIAIYAIFFLKNPAGSQEEKIIVPKGTSIAALSDTLEAHGLLRSRLTFKLAARVLNLKRKLNAGAYRVAHGLSNVQIISRLTGSEYSLIMQATFPEGITALKASRIANRKLGLDTNLFRKLIRDTAFLRELGLPKEAKTAEGYLFPDTYHFIISADPKTLIRLMVERWKQVVTDSVKRLITEKRRISGDPGMTVHEFMTLASIVEAEANVPAERDTIAGVYANRLRIGMKLDADPTVQYGHGLERPISGADVRRDNPYNTYMRKGLPPGPINNPGAAVIHATLNPAKHDKLYFVARRDGTGGHYFSRTIDEQTRMIQVAKRNAARIANDRARIANDRARITDDPRITDERARITDERARIADDRARIADDRAEKK